MASFSLCPFPTQLQCKLSAIKANFHHPKEGFSTDAFFPTLTHMCVPENCNNFCVLYFVCGSCPYEIFKCPELRIYAISTLLLFGLPFPKQILCQQHTHTTHKKTRKSNCKCVNVSVCEFDGGICVSIPLLKIDQICV